MKCFTCDFENPEGVKFCGGCGSKVEKPCPQCGHTNPPQFKFCGECGHSLGRPDKDHMIDYAQPQSYTPKHLVEKILTTRSSIEGERKLVTVFFADVANYTSVSEKLDPEEVHQVMDGAFKILMDEIHKYEGTINQFTGDGVMALFGAPVAHEDHAQRACYTALSVQKAIGDYGEKIKRDRGVEFKMRIGLNSGPVIVGSIGDDLRMDYTAVGDTTNLAARIQQSANPGEIWLSRNTKSMISGFFQVESVGDLELKGKAEPQPTYRLVSEHKEVRTRFEAGLAKGITELVGRRPEMEILKTAWERARSGEARVVDVVGEAGVGKSRLVYEFQKRIAAEANVLTGICIHYGRNINYLPVIDVVREAFGIEEGMSEEEAGDRIQETACGDLVAMIPFYRNLLSLKVDDPRFNTLNPEGRKFGTFEAVKNLLLSLSDARPLLIFLEDVHWMDKISEEFFTYFSRCIHGNPVMMLAAYRPEASPSWAQGALYQKLGLETLGIDSSIRLVMNLLHGLELEPALEGRIAEKAGGNPFFMEEIVRELLERGDLVRDKNRYLCRRPLDQLEIPSTIQGVIAARMDRLSEELKRTMQVASVIGRDFAFRLLKSIMELGEELRGHLTNLVGIEILYQKALYPELEYIFKHALTQEVAYGSLLKQKRQEIHKRIANAIEDQYAGRLEEHYELLAHHYEMSGNAPKAIEFLILAGEKSSRNMAARAAFEFFGKALGLLDGSDIEVSPETEVKVRHGRALAAGDIGDIDTAMDEYRKAVDISRKEAMTDHEMTLLSELAYAIWFSPTKSEEVMDFYDGALARARQLNSKAAESAIVAFKALYICSLGRRYQGNAMAAEAERMALETQDQRAIFICRSAHAAMERWLGNPRKTIELTDGILEQIRGAFSITYLSNVIFVRGSALAECGRIREAMDLLTYGIDTCEKFGGVVHLGRHYNCLGYCDAEIHNTQQAWDLNVKSEEIARRLMDKYPMGRPIAAEVVAQANVNLMENLFDMGKSDDAWTRLKSFEQESKSEDYWRARDRWESRMNVLAVEILIQRNEIGQAMDIIQKELERVKREHQRKLEGRFLRLLGEVLIRNNQVENAIANLNEALLILKGVGNLRQIWQAHASLAAAFGTLNRAAESREQWREAAAVVESTAEGLHERALRDTFLSAAPIREIMEQANR
jgi:class 3 adenylate cyclase/tetratricopeptide (TPR) repeat protein